LEVLCLCASFLFIIKAPEKPSRRGIAFGTALCKRNFPGQNGPKKGYAAHRAHGNRGSEGFITQIFFKIGRKSERGFFMVLTPFFSLRANAATDNVSQAALLFQRIFSFFLAIHYSPAVIRENPK